MASDVEPDGEGSQKKNGGRGKRNTRSNSTNGELTELIACDNCEKWELFANSGLKCKLKDVMKLGLTFTCMFCKMDLRMQKMRDELEVVNNKVSQLTEENKNLKMELNTLKEINNKDTSTDISDSDIDVASDTELPNVKKKSEVRKNGSHNKLKDQVHNLQELVLSLIPEDTNAQHAEISKGNVNKEESWAQVLTRGNKFSQSIQSLNTKVEEMTKVTTTKTDGKNTIKDRRKNVVIYGIKERNLPNHKENAEEDLKSILEILKLTGISEQHIDNTFRLGKIDSRRDRPILVCLNSQIQRDRLLSNWRQVNKDNRKDIFINPDLTFEERKKNKELRDELKERRSKGETDLVMRNGRIECRNKENNLVQSKN